MNNFKIDSEAPIAVIALKEKPDIIKGIRYKNENDENSYVDIVYKKLNTELNTKYSLLPVILIEKNGLTEEEDIMQASGSIIVVVVDDNQRDEYKMFVKYYRNKGYYYNCDRAASNLSILINGYDLRQILRIYRFTNSSVVFNEDGPVMKLFAESFASFDFISKKISGTFLDSIIEVTPLDKGCSLVEITIDENSVVPFDEEILIKSSASMEFDKILFMKNSSFNVDVASKDKYFFMPAFFCSNGIYFYQNVIKTHKYYEEVTEVKEMVVDTISKLAEEYPIDIFINSIEDDVQITLSENSLQIFLSLNCEGFPVNVNEVANNILDGINTGVIYQNLKRFAGSFTKSKNCSTMVSGSKVYLNIFLE